MPNPFRSDPESEPLSTNHDAQPLSIQLACPVLFVAILKPNPFRQNDDAQPLSILAPQLECWYSINLAPSVSGTGLDVAFCSDTPVSFCPHRPKNDICFSHL